MKNSTKYIAIVGGIAVGKTTIGQELNKQISGSVFVEEVVKDNVFLEDFYADKKKWAFHSRISTLSMISDNYLNAIKSNPSANYVIMDRCIDELIVFARLQYELGNLSEREFDVYKQLYNSIISFAPPIDRFIYCSCDTQTTMNRIKLRNRSFEQGITPSYIDKLNGLYLSWIKSITEKAVIFVNTDNQTNISNLLEFISKDR